MVAPRVCELEQDATSVTIGSDIDYVGLALNTFTDRMAAETRGGRVTTR